MYVQVVIDQWITWQLRFAPHHAKHVTSYTTKQVL